MSMKSSVRTIYGSLLQTALRYNDPLKILPNSTLNKKFNVLADEVPTADEKVFTRYLAIGINGFEVQLGSNNLYKINFRDYQPHHASLYEHIPFVLRPLEEDLSSSDRSKYRMRVVKEYGGKKYVGYYLRVLENDGRSADAEKRRIQNKTVVSNPWEPELTDLNPRPMVLNANQRVTNGDEYLAASKKFRIELSSHDMQEIVNAVTIIYKDPGFAELSEFGLCSGADRVVTTNDGGVTQHYTEAVYAQINDFLRMRVSVNENLGGKIINLDAGSVEPLIIKRQ